MEPQRHDLDFAWGAVSYLEWDPGPRAAGPDVLLMHGGGFDSARLSWGGLGTMLSEAGYRVIAPDHPGYGQSPPSPWTATQDRLVSYVRELASGLDLRDYMLGGISLGGGMTIGHLLDQPEGAAGAVLLGSYGLMDHQFEGAFARPAHVLTWIMLRTGLVDAVMRTYGRHRRLMASSVRNIVRDPNQQTPELLDEIMAEAEGGTAPASFGQWQRDQFLWNRLKTNYMRRLDSISVPVLVVHGDRDMGVPVRYARAAAHSIPDSHLLVVSGAGHWVQRDRPDIIAPAMIEFLDGLPR